MTTHLEAIYLGDKLRDVCEQIKGGGARYKEGWSDRRIAEEMNLPKSTVIHLRAKLIGKLVSQNLGEVSREEFDELSEKAEELRVAHNNLIGEIRVTHEEVKTLLARIAALEETNRRFVISVDGTPKKSALGV